MDGQQSRIFSHRRAWVNVLNCEYRASRVCMTVRRPGLSLRGGTAVPQPESGQRQARECYQRACDLKGVVV